MVIYKKKAYSAHSYNVYLELTVALWLVSSLHSSFVLCLNLHIPPMQQVQ